MKKTLIASAVAAATLTLSTGVMAAESALEIYGSVEVAYTHTDEGATTDNSAEDNGSTIGLKHSHMISEGVTAFMKAEFEFAADESTAGINVSDEIYIGVKGDFGSIQYGVDDTVYEWVDVVDTSENTGITGDIADVSERENIQYVSPEIAEGVVVGLTIPVESEAVDVATLAAKYSMDNLEVAFAYAMGRDNKEDTIGLGGSFAMDEITVMAQFETQSDTVDYIGLQGMYTMGQNQFALGYGMKSFDSNALEDESTIALQALHNVSDNMYVYLEYTIGSDVLDEDDMTQGDKDVLALGATYSF